MNLSLFDLFKIGIGPSSSHTVGPMVAARRFLLEAGSLEDVTGIEVALYGSLALTGKGHATDKAVILGLLGETPEGVDTSQVEARLAAGEASGTLALLGRQSIPFRAANHLKWHQRETLPGHPNGLRFMLKRSGGTVHERNFYSVGGGFVVAEGESRFPETATPMEYPFDTMAELLNHGRTSGLSVSQMLRANELSSRTEAQLDSGIARLWQTMETCIDHGLSQNGLLPGGLEVKRRAAHLWAQRAHNYPHDELFQVSLYAMAVNEENAAGGRVVTAPTNGAAGIIPAVLRYYARECHAIDPVKGVQDFLLTAAAIGMLCKRNASLSGAEIGCQGEVGVACAMAAAGLVAALGGTNEQIENAAEIGIEHHLGLTCDPIGGLVQIPCIERNGMGAIKAITAASLALKGDGTHFVSLDAVIETMRRTGADMHRKYKETSLGGLALIPVNLPAC